MEVHEIEGDDRVLQGQPSQPRVSSDQSPHALQDPLEESLERLLDDEPHQEQVFVDVHDDIEDVDDEGVRATHAVREGEDEVPEVGGRVEALDGVKHGVVEVGQEQESAAVHTRPAGEEDDPPEVTEHVLEVIEDPSLSLLRTLESLPDDPRCHPIYNSHQEDCWHSPRVVVGTP